MLQGSSKIVVDYIAPDRHCKRLLADACLVHERSVRFYYEELPDTRVDEARSIGQ